VGINDFASMKEIVIRRYKRLLEENGELPQLIIVDGGKGQLSAAVSGLKELGIYKSIPIIGIAKKLEEIYFPNDPIPIYINKNSTTLKLIQNLRNESHRFGITFHRNKRSAGMLENTLEKINGIGPKTFEKIIREFGSIELLKKSEPALIEEKLGKKIATIILKEINNYSGK
jgi:excinuclease ABC subunit C